MCSGGSRISPRWGRQPSRGRQHTILPKIPKNFVKLKEFGPPGGRMRPSPPPLRSANGMNEWLIELISVNCNAVLKRERYCCPLFSNVNGRPLSIINAWWDVFSKMAAGLNVFKKLFLWILWIFVPFNRFGYFSLLIFSDLLTLTLFFPLNGLAEQRQVSLKVFFGYNMHVFSSNILEGIDSYQFYAPSYTQWYNRSKQKWG